MDPKIILVPLSGEDHDAVALEYAFALAALHKAEVQGWHVAPDPANLAVTYAYGGMAVYPEAAARDMRAANEASRAVAEEKFFAVAQKMKARSMSFHSMVGQAGEIIATRGRVADLTVTGRNGVQRSTNGAIANAALFGSGRPVLLVPPEGSPPKAINGRIVVAWNGSLQAAHAVAFALPYLRRATVQVLTEVDYESGRPPLSVEDLTDYLEHHGIRADKTVVRLQGEASLPASVLDAARDLGGDLLVMGAWGHSRFREYVLGGMTDFMLRHADIPLFMAH